FLLLFMAPALLNKQFGPYPLMKIGDVFDLFTPLILIPLYWLLYRLDGNRAPSLGESLVFLLFVAFWVAGQGMHLSANSISHFLKGMEGSDVYNLTSFYDEVLSHYLWHFGVVGLSALLIYRQWRNPFIEDRIVLWPLILAGIIHGLTLFIIFVEGGTTPLGVIFVVLITFLGLIWGRKRFGRQPLLLFFFIACSLATLLLAGWGVYWHGLPEFSEVGIID
ncbi:MAG: hypothetical protein KAJ19_14165, partial [Gammaproteobacteria bacterium]|nr:hypothetical protein [Gammaproteobacteria bacterium]